MSVYFYGCITLDGYLADKNHKLDWLFEVGTTEETEYDSFYQKMDITIMGKKTFDFIATIEEKDTIYSTTTNYVFTHSKDLPLNQFKPVNGDVATFVSDLPIDKNIWIIGGNSILAPLLDHDLVDVMMIQIAPVLLGSGIPLFTQQDGLKKWHLQKINHYGQFAELVYHK